MKEIIPLLVRSAFFESSDKVIMAVCNFYEFTSVFVGEEFSQQDKGGVEKIQTPFELKE